MANEILVATATFQATIDGQETVFTAGKTTIRAGHPLLKGFAADLFVPLVPTFDFEAPAPKADPPKPDPPKADPPKPKQTKAPEGQSGGE